MPDPLVFSPVAQAAAWYCLPPELAAVVYQRDYFESHYPLPAVASDDDKPASPTVADLVAAAASKVVDVEVVAAVGPVAVVEPVAV